MLCHETIPCSDHESEWPDSIPEICIFQQTPLRRLPTTAGSARPVTLGKNFARPWAVPRLNPEKRTRQKRNHSGKQRCFWNMPGVCTTSDSLSKTASAGFRKSFVMTTTWKKRNSLCIAVFTIRIVRSFSQCQSSRKLFWLQQISSRLIFFPIWQYYLAELFGRFPYAKLLLRLVFPMPVRLSNICRHSLCSPDQNVQILRHTAYYRYTILSCADSWIVKSEYWIVKNPPCWRMKDFCVFATL